MLCALSKLGAGIQMFHVAAVRYYSLLRTCQFGGSISG
jgi:hypothetical protein